MIFKGRYTGDMCPVNQRYTRYYRLSERYREASIEMEWSLKNMWPFPAIDRAVKLKIETHYPRMHDCDAFCKIIFDSFQKSGVLKNDKQVCGFSVDRVISKDFCGFDFEIHEV